MVFTGFLPAEDLPGLLNSVDILIMPRDAELLSNSTLEPMACGLPVVCADALALPELVKYGTNGYLFKSGDVANLRGKMDRIDSQPERWSALGQVSRKIAKAHSLDLIPDEFKQLYHIVVGQTTGIAAELLSESTAQANSLRKY